MGGRGPAPVPTALKVLRGAKKRRATREPQPAIGAPPAPAWVVERPEASALWAELVAVLPRGVLTAADAKAMELACRVWVELAADQAACERDGRVLVVRADDGTVKSITPAPWAVRFAKLAPVFRSLLAELGCSPASRTRVAVVPDAAPDPFEAFLGKRGSI